MIWIKQPYQPRITNVLQATKLRAATTLNHHLLSTPNKNSKIPPPAPFILPFCSNHKQPHDNLPFALCSSTITTSATPPPSHHKQPKSLKVLLSIYTNTWHAREVGDEQKTLGEERKAPKPHTEASAKDEELQTIPVCFRRTSDEEDGDIVNGEEEDDVVNGEEHGGVRRTFHESDRETFKMKKN
ncbi:unnamed protein product [Lactuca virosa]|uniref:Uncharacterized protein n=1 Tax=Lactuca virosa TaxID=75947 RepID=A0AAU9NQP6_9ASTR|nr:unnamed protein product [Lactuca virosa]